MGLTTREFMTQRSELNDLCETLLHVKGSEYAQADIEDNRLNNFERVAERVASTPPKVLMTYLLKHIDSIEKWVRTGTEGTEGITGRIADARNYLDLLYGMVEHGSMQRRAEAVGVALAPGSMAVKACNCHTWSQADPGKDSVYHGASCPRFTRDTHAPLEVNDG